MLSKFVSTIDNVFVPISDFLLEFKLVLPLGKMFALTSSEAEAATRGEIATLKRNYFGQVSSFE